VAISTQRRSAAVKMMPICFSGLRSVSLMCWMRFSLLEALGQEEVAPEHIEQYDHCRDQEGHAIAEGSQQAARRRADDKASSGEAADQAEVAPAISGSVMSAT